jgi:hypothetical protein
MGVRVQKRVQISIFIAIATALAEVSCFPDIYGRSRRIVPPNPSPSLGSDWTNRFRGLPGPVLIKPAYKLGWVNPGQEAPARRQAA